MSPEDVTLVVQDAILGDWKFWFSHQKFVIPTIGSTFYNSKWDALFGKICLVGMLMNYFFEHISDTICWGGLERRVWVWSTVWEVVDNTDGYNTITIGDNTVIFLQCKLHRGKLLISCIPSNLVWVMTKLTGIKYYYTIMKHIYQYNKFSIDWFAFF